MNKAQFILGYIIQISFYLLKIFFLFIKKKLK